MGSLLSVHEQPQVVSHANNLEGTPAASATFGSPESKTFSQSRMEDAARSFFAAIVESIGRLHSCDQSSNSLFSSSSSSWTLNWVGFARLLCGVIGIFGIAGAYNLVYIYTLEQL